MEVKVTTSRRFFETIAGPVLYDKDSPYRLMTKKLNDIDIDYFERVDAAPLGRTLDDSLRIELKKRILGDFVAYGNTLISETADGIERQIVQDVKLLVESSPDTTEALDALKEAMVYMHTFVRKQLCFVPIPMYDKAELRELYDAAKKETLLERVTGSNEKDVIKYYHALIEHCMWACRMLLRRRAGQFLMQMVDVLSREFDLNSSVATTFNDKSSLDPETGLPLPLSPLVEGLTKKFNNRNTAVETLRFIVSQGFRIERS